MIGRRLAYYASKATKHRSVHHVVVAASMLLLLILTISLRGPRYADAQTPDPTDRVHEIAKRLNCPTCAGRSLSDCQTDTCTQWKQEIASQLEAGKSPQEVIDFFQARFGPTVLQEPPKEGVVLLLWALPILALVGLVIGVAIVLKRVTTRKLAPVIPAETDTEHTLADEYVRRVEEEVRRP